MKIGLVVIFFIFVTGGVTAWVKTPGGVLDAHSPSYFYQHDPQAISAWAKLTHICANPSSDFIDSNWPDFMPVLQDAGFDILRFVGVFSEVDLCKTMKTYAWWQRNGLWIFQSSVLGAVAAFIIFVIFLAWGLRRASGEAIISGLALGLRAHRRVGRSLSGLKQRVQDRADGAGD